MARWCWCSRTAHRCPRTRRSRSAKRARRRRRNSRMPRPRRTPRPRKRPLREDDMTAPTKPVVGVTTVGSQKDRRYLDTFYDQHRSTRFPNGRPWWGYREIAANRDMNPNLRDGFCGGELMPGRHPDEGESRESAWRDLWSAPWVAEYRFFQLDYKRN